MLWSKFVSIQEWISCKRKAHEMDQEQNTRSIRPWRGSCMTTGVGGDTYEYVHIVWIKGWEIKTEILKQYSLINKIYIERWNLPHCWKCSNYVQDHLTLWVISQKCWNYRLKADMQIEKNRIQTYEWVYTRWYERVVCYWLWHHLPHWNNERSERTQTCWCSQPFPSCPREGKQNASQCFLSIAVE